MLIAQVIQESGAQQYDRNGDLVVSNTGAIGFGQILRSTSILYLKKCINYRDSLLFSELGVTDYSFAKKFYLKRKKWAMAKDWLSNETNNIAMWGKIMSDELKRKDIITSLVTYNIGPRALKKYIKSGGLKEEHHYIVAIKSKLKFVK
jgi:hypothetical protein